MSVRAVAERTPRSLGWPPKAIVRLYTSWRAWDADLRRHAGSWRYQSFRGDAWTTIHKEDRKRYLLNAYRVLLTRARQGMIVFVAPGDPSDPTRAPSFYDDTYQYLMGLGVADI